METTIQPGTGPIDAAVELPGSKSHSNRALLIAARPAGRAAITGTLFSDGDRLLKTFPDFFDVLARVTEGGRR